LLLWDPARRADSIAHRQYNQIIMRDRILGRAILLAVLLLAASSSAARAQAYISPFIGFDFGGDSGCRTASACEERTSNIGVAIGSTGALLGFEEEFAYARNFFGKSAGQSNNVVTAMSNLLVAPRIGPVRPYGVIGIGIIKTRVSLTLSDLATSDTGAGWNIGGGLEVGGAHIGVRGDVRYMHGFSNLAVPLLPVQDLKLDFGRASAGLVLRF
jgi:hypothetical protein